MTLTEFLLTRIAEDEEAAEAVAFDGGWFAHEGGVWVAHDPDESSSSGLTGRLPIWGGFVAEHMVRFQPSRILAECAAKRRIVEEHALAKRDSDHAVWQAWLRAALLLALPYADHPDYREEWKL